MEQEHKESAGMPFDPVHVDGLNLAACPFLGLEKDPNTLLAYPNQANYCHRFRVPVGIEPAHQSGYCLSGSHTACHVYGQPDDAFPPEEPQAVRRIPALPAITLPSLDDLPSLQPHLESIVLRGQSLRLRLLLFRLRLRSRMPKMPAMGERVLKLRERLSAAGQARQLPENKDLPRIPGPRFLKQVDARLFAVPFMLLLILAAAIIWWPPPGGSEQDAIVAGAAIVKETPEILEEQAETAETAGPDGSRSESRVDLRDQATAASSDPDAPGASDEPTRTGAEDTGQGAEAQGALTDSLTAADTADKSPSSSEAGSITAPDSAAVQAEDKNLSLHAEAAEADNPDSAEDRVLGAESVATAEPAVLPAAVIASIGPSAGVQDVQSIYESTGPLFLHAAPGEETAVVALITEQQPASILGRDSSGEWLLVRLSGGIEGWAKTALSGADILVSNLPAVDGGVEVPETENNVPDEPEGATAVVNIGALNLRAGPGIEFESIGIVYNKEEVSLVQPPGSNGWVQVRLADGRLGWLNSSYLILPG